MNRVSNRQTGFTIIELLLAMSFISLLLLAIAMTVLQIGKIYNKGIAVNQVDVASQVISDDIRQTMTMSGRVVLDDGHYLPGDSGRLCLGTYTYVWNSGAAIARADANRAVYSGNDSSVPLNFIKVEDPQSALCAVTGRIVIDRSAATELLDTGDHNLAIHQFMVEELVYDTISTQSLYRLSFTIGTNDQTTLTNVPQGVTVCKSAGESGADLDYCFVQDFRVVVRTGSGG